MSEIKRQDLAKAMRQPPLGAYRRAVRIAADAGLVTLAMEDDVHSFTLSLEHENGVVTTIAASADRTPWTNCPGAVQQLQSLRGKSLETLRRLPGSERAAQCLHLYDLVLLATRHAGKSSFERLYRAEGDYDQSPPLFTLWLNGAQVLRWAVDNGRITGSAFDGVALRQLPRTLADCSEDETEAALILRRAAMISPVRTVDFEAFDHMLAIDPNGGPSCYAKQPQRRAEAARRDGIVLNFSAEDRWPLDH